MNYKITQGQAEIIVLLPHYNDNQALKNVINSVVEPFPVDILIIDDGSEIKPNEQELKEIYGSRGHLEVKYSPQNIKVSKIRNIGLKMISQTKYKYIGHMDSDDPNRPNRFAKQLDFLKNNDHISLVGSWGDYYDENGKFLFTLKPAVSDKEIKRKMYLNSMFINTSVLYRCEILKGIKEYPYKNVAADDYHFYFLVIKKYNVANYPEALVKVTVRLNSISSKHRFKQVWERIKIITENFYFGFYPIWGLTRNMILLFIPRGFGLKIRKMFKIERTPI